MKKIRKLILRQKSIITDKKHLKILYSFKNFPVFMGCVDQGKEKDLIADMDWVIDPESGIIQLGKLLPLKFVYQNQHNDGTGDIWETHYQQFAKFLHKVFPKKVLEIGAANGVVANKYLKLDTRINWTIIEPHPIFKGNKKIKVIGKWFDKKMAEKIKHDKFDTIVHTHVLEHIYEPKTYLQDIYNALKVGGKHIFSIPNMHQQLVDKYTNCLNFEHTVFLREEYVDYLLKSCGFEILKKKYFTKHSIFYATRKTNSIPTHLKPPKLYLQNKKLFMNFVTYHKNLIDKLNNRVAKSSSPVYLFGAHIFSQFLIAFGLKSRKIVNVLDNSSLKQGKRLYGTHLIVASPRVLEDKKRPIVILKAGIYNDEIKKEIRSKINKNVIFV